MNLDDLKQTHTTSDLNSKFTENDLNNFMETTNEFSQTSFSKNKNRSHQNIPSTSPNRKPNYRNLPPGFREVPRMRKSINMRPNPDSSSQNHSHIYKDSDSGRVFLSRSQNKHDFPSQHSNRVHRKLKKSDSASQNDSRRNIEMPVHRPTRHSNIRLKEMGDHAFAEDYVERDDSRTPGMRTPGQFRSRPFSRRNSDFNLPKKSGSSVSRVKTSEREIKRASSKKLHELQIQRNEEVGILKNKVNKLTLQLQSSRAAESKLKIQINDLKGKNTVLRSKMNQVVEQNKELRREQSSVGKKLMQDPRQEPGVAKGTGRHELGAQ